MRECKHDTTANYALQLRARTPRGQQRGEVASVRAIFCAIRSSIALTDKASLLKRLLVHRSPVMPTGILIFCLEYAEKDTTPLPGIFTSVRGRFSDLAAGGLKELVEQCYDLRNTYIAHEKSELSDPTPTREALQTWSDALVELHSALQAHATATT